jgi:hypothetical protein
MVLARHAVWPIRLLLSKTMELAKSIYVRIDAFGEQ